MGLDNPVTPPLTGVRIVVVTPYFPPAIGGACRMMGNIAAHFSALGNDVIVLTLADTSSDEAADSSSTDYGSTDYGKVVRVPYGENSYRSALATGIAFARFALTRRHDLYFCGVSFPASVLAYAISRITRTPYVVYTHGEDFTVVKNPLLRALLNRSVAKAAHVFTNSTFTYDAVVAACGNQRSTTTLFPGIDTARLASATDDDAQSFLHAQQLDNAGNNILLTVARLQDRKGHATVVEALPEIAKHVPDVHYVVVGKGDPSALTKIAKLHGVEDRLHVIPSLSESDLTQAYRASKLHVMVSREEDNEVEGFGMVYLEAGAAGRTSVAGNQGGTSDAVLHNVTGVLVDPLSTTDTAHAVIDLLTDDERRERMAKAAHDRTIANFTIDVFLSKLTATCEKVARRRS